MTKRKIEECAVRADGSAQALDAVSAQRRMSNARLLRDQRGVSTAEYAVLFVVLCIGSLATWKSLSKSVHTQVTNGTNQLSSVLQSHIQAANASDADNEAASGPSMGMGAMPGKLAPSTAPNSAPSNTARLFGSQGLGNQQQVMNATNDTQAFNKALAGQQQASASNDKSRSDKRPSSTRKGPVKGDTQANRSAASVLKDDQGHAQVGEPGTNKGEVKGDIQQANPSLASGSKGEVKGDIQQANSAVAEVPKGDNSTRAVSTALKGGRR